MSRRVAGARFRRTILTHRRLAVLCVLALGASACNRPGQDPAAFKWTSELPAGSIIHIRDGAGSITVRRSPNQVATINGSRRWARGRASDVRFVVSQVGNEYYVCAMWRGSGNCGESGYRGRRTGGILQVFSLFHRNSDASASFVAEIPANVVIDARTSLGSVDVNGVAAGVTARSSNGTVSASNVAGPVSLVTTNGDVRLSLDSLVEAGTIELTTTNGSINAELPSSADGSFDLSASNGNVRSEFPLAPASASHAGRHLIGQIGASGRTVKMRTRNGIISVVARHATAAE